jgi:tetratricopeptide (TPR) repeat protein
MATLEASLVLADKGAAGANEVLALLDLAATRYPLDVDVQRLRLSVVQTYAKWQAADRAIGGLTLALYHALGTAHEAHLAAARIRAQLGQWNAAFTEYRIALTEAPGEVSTWFEFGHFAEVAGRDSLAREAYSEAVRLAPSNPDLIQALRRTEARQGISSLPRPGN